MVNSDPPRPVDLTGFIRIGILVLPVCGALKIVGNLGTFDSIGYGIPQATEANAVAGAGFVFGEFFGSMLPVLLAPFWIFALAAYLATKSRRGALLTGVVLCVIGAGLALAALGVVNYAIPALGHAYLANHSFAMTIADSFFTWPNGAVIYPAVLFPVGVVVLTVAAWPTDLVPRLALALYAVSSVLIAIPFPFHSLRLAGGVLGLLAGGWIAVAVRNQLVGSKDRRVSSGFDIGTTPTS